MEPGQSYHIYNHANGNENIFREEENYLFFLKHYAKYLRNVVDTYAYCLMPSHFHLLVGTKVERLLRRTFPKFQNFGKVDS
jgi:putative transposase